MALYKIEVNKVRNEYKWRNTYHCATPDTPAVLAFAVLLGEMEMAIHTTGVFITTISIRNLDTLSVAPIEYPFNEFALRAPTGTVLAPTQVARVDFRTDGYAGMKLYRYSAGESDVTIWDLTEAYKTELETAIGTVLSELPTDLNWLTAGGFTIVEAQAYPLIQPRQLHRKRKPVTPPA